MICTVTLFVGGRATSKETIQNLALAKMRARQLAAWAAWAHGVQTAAIVEPQGEAALWLFWVQWDPPVGPWPWPWPIGWTHTE